MERLRQGYPNSSRTWALFACHGLLDFRDGYYAPGAGCSITSTATVSTTGATGGFTFRSAFFTGARLSLALATVRFIAFAALATLRAFPRLAENAQT